MFGFTKWIKKHTNPLHRRIEGLEKYLESNAISHEGNLEAKAKEIYSRLDVLNVNFGEIRADLGTSFKATNDRVDGLLHKVGNVESDLANNAMSHETNLESRAKGIEENVKKEVSEIYRRLNGWEKDIKSEMDERIEFSSESLSEFGEKLTNNVREAALGVMEAKNQEIEELKAQIGVLHAKLNKLDETKANKRASAPGRTKKGVVQ